MPVDKTKFIEQFKAETKEHLENLNQGFLDLEKTPENLQLLNNLMREAHTIKGSASMMGYRSIADIAHKIEDGFDRTPGQDIQIQKGHFDLLFECLDTIESLLEGTPIRKAKALDDTYVLSLCDQLAESFKSGESQPNQLENKETCNAVNSRQTQCPLIEEAPQPENEAVTPQTHEDAPADGKESQRDTAKQQEPEDGPLEKSPQNVNQKSVRIEIDKLNSLMNLSGEMVITKIRLNELVRELNEKADQVKVVDERLYELIQQLNTVDDNIDFITNNIQQEVLNLRMIPISYLFGTFPRVMRDLAKQQHKTLEFDVTGEETHLDKSIIDELRTPFMHLLRNAVDHGIESPAERENSNKSPVGRISINAYRIGSQVVIEISDDGKGIDVERVKDLAIEKEVISKTEAERLTQEQVFQLIFAPGFTTTDTVTETSGRGIGLDVVHDSIQKLKGVIEIRSERKKGTTFIIKLPLTLSITESLLVACGDDVFSIPIENIAETTRIAPSEIETVGSKEVVTVRDQIIPLIRIHQLFQLPKKGIIEKDYLPVVVVRCAEKKVGLLVDQVVKHQEIVIKPLGDPLRNVQNIAGGTVLGSGRVILILDVASIIDRAKTGSETKTVPVESTKHLSSDQAKTVLLAEDTLTTAMLERNILEAAGFNVVVARDGEEAFRTASREKFDLVISDVLMPKMNGFELTAKLKKDAHYANVPVIIVTTREGDEDKRRGLQAGADAYILKKDFTCDSLLETIERLIN